MMSEENSKKVCGLCGQRVHVSDLKIDEKEGLALCPICIDEQESCGCSDEEE
jgi:hypothetical protein